MKRGAMTRDGDERLRARTNRTPFARRECLRQPSLGVFRQKLPIPPPETGQKATRRTSTEAEPETATLTAVPIFVLPLAVEVASLVAVAK